ncbi:MAG: hypothetical protein ACOC40_02025 [Thermoplasmatota archaeon]
MMNALNADQKLYILKDVRYVLTVVNLAAHINQYIIMEKSII